MPTVDAEAIGDGTPASGGLDSALRRAVEASHSGIVITDAGAPENPVVYVNSAFEKLTGYPAEEVLGRDCRFLQGEDREQPELAKLRAAIREGRECRVVLRNYRKSGEQFSNELYVSPVRDDSGALSGFVGVQNDVSESRRAEEARDVRKRSSLLAGAAQALHSSLDYSETLERITRLFVPELAEWCVLDTVRDDGAVRQAAEAHADPQKARLLGELREPRVFEPDSREARNLLHLEHPTLVEGAGETLMGGSSLFRGLQPRSCLRVPLLAREHTLGVVTLFSSEKDRYGEAEVALAESLANRCALALDNARLYGERERIARTLQRGLIPHLPETEEVEVGKAYRPVGGDGEVGGDFYDLTPAPREPDSSAPTQGSGGWIALAGDVCGKGVLAAASTALIRYAARAVTLRERSPAAILAALNEAVLREFSEHCFCTTACLLLEPDEHGLRLTLARGGHPSPVILRSGGSVEKLDPPGKAIGVFPNPDFTEQKARLAPGDAVLLYTDGVTEARSPDEAFFGEERLLSLLRSSAGLEASAIADRVLDAVMQHSRENPTDDLAILALRAPKRQLESGERANSE